MIKKKLINKKSFLYWYQSPIALICCATGGLIAGVFFAEYATIFKVIGDVFLNLLYTLIIPLVFFSIASSVATNVHGARLKKIMSLMLLFFAVTGIIASFLMLLSVKLIPVMPDFMGVANSSENASPLNLLTHFVGAFTVSSCADLLHAKNVLALILVSALIGWATACTQDDGLYFAAWLKAGNKICMHALSCVMLLGPVGIGAYCAYSASTFGYGLLTTYSKMIGLYYGVGILYFVLGFSLYAYIAGGMRWMKDFWSLIASSATTAFATGSSFATIPANLKAAKEIGVSDDIADLVIPVGATMHMDGSCLAAILKMILLCSIYNVDYSSLPMMAMMIFLSLLCGMVVSGIPSGGIFGEMLIISMFGFPPEALPLITTVGILVDPLATMINATGDVIISMLVHRFAKNTIVVTSQIDMATEGA